MATYKVIQDIEAEDKFVGPLTLRQFIYAALFVVCCYISFIFITKHVWFLVIPLLPIFLLSGFLGFPWGRDQPTEVWLLAKVRFYFKPRQRIWDQTGIQELVTITAPKKVEEHLTKELTQTEVRSRLAALANTIDSRGWVVKDQTLSLSTQPHMAMASLNASDDRLTGASVLPQQSPIVDIQAADDIMDESSNPTAQKLDEMIAETTAARKQELLRSMDAARKRAKEPQKTIGNDKPAPDYWFMDKPDTSQIKPGYATFEAKTIAPGAQAESKAELSAEDKALLDKVHKQKAKERAMPPAYGHMRIVKPLTHGPAGKKQKPGGAVKAVKQAKPAPPAPITAAPPMTQTPDPDILKLAINNDRNVASLAREAEANRKKEEPDEVVISLH